MARQARVRPSTGAGVSIERFSASRLAGQADGAPLQHLHRIEIVRLDLLDQFFVERIDLAGDAGAVAQMAAGAAGDLAKLGGGKIAILVAVELAVLREGDVVEVEIEAHADRVGGDEVVVDIGLVERDCGLRVRGESAPSTTAAPPRWRRTSSAMA